MTLNAWMVDVMGEVLVLGGLMLVVLVLGSVGLVVVWAGLCWVDRRWR